MITSSDFKLQKWFLHQNGVESNQKSKSDLTKLWPVVGSPKHAEKMLIQLRSPTAPSWPAVQYFNYSHQFRKIVHENGLIFEFNFFIESTYFALNKAGMCSVLVDNFSELAANFVG